MINSNKYHDLSILKVLFIGFEPEKFEKFKRRSKADFHILFNQNNNIKFIIYKEPAKTKIT